MTYLNPATVRERIILGVDPGTSVMGYGLIQVDMTPTQRTTLHLLQYGVIHLKKYARHEQKLEKIFERMIGLIDQYAPDEMALEAPFFGKNVQSMLKLGRAQGVAMAAALSRQIPIVEYAPKKVKQAVTGNGSASKEKVAQMLKSLVKFPTTPDERQLHDATDAVAVALCHHYQKASPVHHAKSWSAFITDHPDRIKN